MENPLRTARIYISPLGEETFGQEGRGEKVFRDKNYHDSFRGNYGATARCMGLIK